MSANKRYTDPISGIDYRWDDAKNKWVKSTGRDPWSDQLQPYLERQSRLTQESFGKYSLDNIRQNVSGMIEQNRSLNDQQRGLGVQLLNWVENLGFFAEDTDSPTSNFEATTMSEGGNKDMTQPRTWQNPEGQLSDKPSTGDLAMFDQPEKGEITDPKKQDLKMKTWENPIYGDERDLKSEAQARIDFLSKNTPANKAFAEGDYRKADWDEMRWKDFGKPQYESNLLKNQK